MHQVPRELELPLGDPNAGALALRRLAHLAAVAGVGTREAEVLTRRFPSLARIYSATQDELTAAVGAVAAARIRWFLDAPFNNAVAIKPINRATAAA